jgi:hypothetical protein
MVSPSSAIVRSLRRDFGGPNIQRPPAVGIKLPFDSQA